METVDTVDKLILTVSTAKEVTFDFVPTSVLSKMKKAHSAKIAGNSNRLRQFAVKKKYEKFSRNNPQKPQHFHLSSPRTPKALMSQQDAVGI